jgi:hypothetical protein
MKRLLRTCLAVAVGAFLTASGCTDNEKEAGITGKENPSAPAADYLNSLPGKSTKYSSGDHAYPGSGAAKAAESTKAKPAETPKAKAAEAANK